MLNVESIGSFYSSKVLEFDKLEKKIAELKKKDKKFALCHGGFDLLHPGHIKHFESAKKLCDYLVVSITSDRFVTSRKGSGRPIFPDRLRAYAVACTEFVDFVVISDFEKGVEVIEKLKPNYYVKGPDFFHKDTPGINAERKAIKEVGGEMKYTEDPKLSTSEIVKYIKEEMDENKVLVGIDRDGTLIEDVGFLGKNKDWKKEIKFRKHIVDILDYIQTKYDSTMIVVSNQSGIARGYFDCGRVEEINQHIDNTLRKKGIKIDNWQYCPDVDSRFAELKNSKINFDMKFVKEKVKRKPDPAMLMDGLKELKKNILEFKKIIIIGDQEIDKELAIKLNALYIDADNDGYNVSIKKVKEYA